MRRFVRHGLRLAVVLVLTSGVHARAGFLFETIDVPGASFTTHASGINDVGEVVGGYFGGVGHHGFLYDGGGFTAIDVPGASLTDASGINDAGQVVGIFYDSADGGHGFLATPAVPEPPG